MRKELGNLGSEERHTFIAEFSRFGIKSGYKGVLSTVLLQNIRTIDGKFITDHLWLNKTKGFAKLNLQKGDTVSFEARVSGYVKGYQGEDFEKQLDCPLEFDYKLSYPTHITIVSKCPPKKGGE